VVIGLEEIVDLNAGNLVKASTSNQRVWREGLKKVRSLHCSYFTFILQAINEHPSTGGDKYLVLACEQLVGVCLIVFAKSSLISRIRDLSLGEVKTGMGGATGNKGKLRLVGRSFKMSNCRLFGGSHDHQFDFRLLCLLAFRCRYTKLHLSSV